MVSPAYGLRWVVFLLVGSAAASAAIFVPLGDLPGGGFQSDAFAVSGDGSVVVGQSLGSKGYEAFRWTAAGGMVGLGDLPGGDHYSPGGGYFSAARGVSRDGSVVVGYGAGASGWEAFRWTAASGLVGLGDLPGGAYQSLAYGVSGDGTVIVGLGHGEDGSKAVRHTDGGGLEELGLPPGSYGVAFGVSGDGSVVVGQRRGPNQSEAFRWTAGGGMEGLGGLPPDDMRASSHAWAVSGDGSVVVGQRTLVQPIDEAFRWTAASGLVGLGHLPGDSTYSVAYGASGDGSVIVGRGWGWRTRRPEAFRWTAATGMRNIRELLLADGIDMTGWRLDTAYGVSADGTTMVGFGVNPAGNLEGWLAHFDAAPVIPEPSSLWLLGVGLVAAGRRRAARPR